MGVLGRELRDQTMAGALRSVSGQIAVPVLAARDEEATPAATCRRSAARTAACQLMISDMAEGLEHWQVDGSAFLPLCNPDQPCADLDAASMRLSA